MLEVRDILPGRENEAVTRMTTMKGLLPKPSLVGVEIRGRKVVQEGGFGRRGYPVLTYLFLHHRRVLVAAVVKTAGCRRRRLRLCRQFALLFDLDGERKGPVRRNAHMIVDSKRRSLEKRKRRRGSRRDDVVVGGWRVGGQLLRGGRGTLLS